MSFENSEVIRRPLAKELLKVNRSAASTASSALTISLTRWLSFTEPMTPRLSACGLRDIRSAGWTRWRVGGTVGQPVSRRAPAVSEWRRTMSDVGKTNIVVMWTVGPDDVLEGDRIFESHVDWMVGHPRNGDT